MLTFADLEISNAMTKAVGDLGYKEPTPIQAQTIPPILQGRDVTGQAKTGTGKTAAFGIPLLERIKPQDRSVQGLILCPTRELAIQVERELSLLAKYKSGIRTLAIYGGRSINPQIDALKRGVQIVVGTPGRLLDHARRKTLRLDAVKMVVVDEADVMLDMGFVNDIEAILRQTPSDRQTLFFSATLPKAVLALTKKYQRNPQFIRIETRGLTVAQVRQEYYEIPAPSKRKALERLLNVYNPFLTLVFCNTKRRVDRVAKVMKGHGFRVESLHGDMNQSQRNQVMRKFRNGDLAVLVASDVAARGLDVENIDLVVNYDLPRELDLYVHRIGRTGRAGKSGAAVSFATGLELRQIKDIQRHTKASIKRMDSAALLE